MEKDEEYFKIASIQNYSMKLSYYKFYLLDNSSTIDIFSFAAWAASLVLLLAPETSCWQGSTASAWELHVCCPAACSSLVKNITHNEKHI